MGRTLPARNFLGRGSDCPFAEAGAVERVLDAGERLLKLRNLIGRLLPLPDLFAQLAVQDILLVGSNDLQFFVVSDAGLNLVLLDGLHVGDQLAYKHLAIFGSGFGIIDHFPIFTRPILKIINYYEVLIKVGWLLLLLYHLREPVVC